MSRPDSHALAGALRARVAPARGFERPRIFDLADAADRAALDDLMRSEPALCVRDELCAQVAELVHARCPERKRDSGRDNEVCAMFLADRDPDTFGRWVHYPWRRALVRLLPEPEFVELRSARNQLHISADAQRSLRAKTIGIVGLSVGYAMALTLALEGVGGRFRLADFDRLELSNTNRLPSGVTALGHNKAVLAARAMFEVDPYLEIEVYQEGVRAESASRFFEQGGRLDLLIEECDDLPMKLALRELARELRVPVICETSQRGLLDVERFDREPGRAPFHGLLGEVSAASLARLSPREKAPFLLRFLQGADNMSTTLAASLVEIEQSLAGWPQLASSVVLGGAVVTDAARRMLLGSFTRSGRFQVDMEAIVHDAADAPLREAVAAVESQQLPTEPRPSRTVVDEDARARWVRWATLAPSGGNVQPWRFEEEPDGALVCKLDLRGGPSALDPDARAARVACGAALVNLRLAAGRDGFRSDVSWEPDPRHPELLYRCRFARDPEPRPDELSEVVELRCTNRRLTAHTPLRAAAREALESEARRWGGELIIHESEAARAAVAQLLGELERVRLFSEPFYREMMAELVDASDAPTGISLATLELSPADRAALQILRRREVVALLRDEQRGRGLIELARKPAQASSALCLLHVSGHGTRAALEGGVALQRVWLRATRLGLALQPISAGLYMLQQLERERGPGSLEPWERAQLERLRGPFLRHFPLPAGRSAVLVFRLFEAPAPSARSARLPLEAVLSRHPR